MSAKKAVTLLLHWQTGNIIFKVSCFFTPVLLFPGFTAGENTATKLAKATPRKPGENGRSQHSGIRHFLRARFYQSDCLLLPHSCFLSRLFWGTWRRFGYKTSKKMPIIWKLQCRKRNSTSNTKNLIYQMNSGKS